MPFFAHFHVYFVFSEEVLTLSGPSPTYRVYSTLTIPVQLMQACRDVLEDVLVLVMLCPNAFHTSTVRYATFLSCILGDYIMSAIIIGLQLKWDSY